MILLSIELDQDSMLIDKKKDIHRGSYVHFLKARQQNSVKAPFLGGKS